MWNVRQRNGDVLGAAIAHHVACVRTDEEAAMAVAGRSCVPDLGEPRGEEVEQLDVGRCRMTALQCFDQRYRRGTRGADIDPIAGLDHANGLVGRDQFWTKLLEEVRNRVQEHHRVEYLPDYSKLCCFNSILSVGA